MADKEFNPDEYLQSNEFNPDEYLGVTLLQELLQLYQLQQKD